MRRVWVALAAGGIGVVGLGAGCRSASGCVDKERSVEVDEQVLGTTADALLTGVPRVTQTVLVDEGGAQHTLSLTVEPDLHAISAVSSEYRKGRDTPFIAITCTDALTVEADVSGQVEGPWSGAFAGRGTLTWAAGETGAIASEASGSSLSLQEGSFDPVPDGVVMVPDGMSLGQVEPLLFAWSRNDQGWTSVGLDVQAEILDERGRRFADSATAFLSGPPQEPAE